VAAADRQAATSHSSGVRRAEPLAATSRLGPVGAQGPRSHRCDAYSAVGCRRASQSRAASEHVDDPAGRRRAKHDHQQARCQDDVLSATIRNRHAPRTLAPSDSGAAAPVAALVPPLHSADARRPRCTQRGIGRVGWHGIVPSKALPMANDIVDNVMLRLINVSQVLGTPPWLGLGLAIALSMLARCLARLPNLGSTCCGYTLARLPG